MPESDYSLIIPVLKMEGNPYLEGLLKSLSEQSSPPKAVHLIVGDRRQGRAINFGVSQAQTEYIGTVDDDTQIDDPELFAKLLRAIQCDSTIGIAGAACELPEHASCFQKKAMKQIPRRLFPIQQETVDSDMVQHPCLVMPRSLFLKIEGEDEELIRGLDPVLRKKVRDAGRRVVVVADTWVYHLLPDSLWRVMKMYYRNGVGSGYASRNYPDRVLELTDGYDHGDFIEQRSFTFRLFRRIKSLLYSMICVQYIKVLTDLAYALAVLKERLFPSPALKIPKVANIISESNNTDYTFTLHIHRVSLAE